MVCVIVAGWLSWQNSIPHLVQRYHTEAGQRSVVHLADGSVLTLAPSTSVRVSPTSITVSGEVSFVVAHRSTRPFEVRTSTATVQLLGTVFGVRQYPDERHTRVVVDEGKLSVRTRHHDASLGEPRVISARMLAIVTDSDVTVTSGMTMSNNAGVVSGTLVFNQSKLSDMVLTLSRAYGIDIQIADTTLASQTLSMDVAVTEESPNQVLNSICNVTDAHYVRRGETYVITPGRRDAHRPPSGPRYYLFPQSESQYGR
jgi:ferric-dicitrate binding protein FerR (iron transport regulator)